MIEIHLWLLITMIGAIVLLAVMLWNNLREREFHVRVPDLDCFEQALPSIAGMTKAVILEGNRARIIQNGDFFTDLLASIAGELKAAFEDDLKACEEMKAESWNRKYHFWHRALDRACYLLSGQL